MSTDDESQSIGVNSSSCCEMNNCGISGFVLCRYSAAPSLDSFSRRLVHMAEGGGFLCVSKLESSPDEKIVCPSQSEDSDGMLSTLWNQPFLQIQILLDVDTISEYTGVTAGVSSQYAFGLQGQGRPVTAGRGSRGSTNGHKRSTDGQIWALLFSSAQERDVWKEVLLRVLQGAEKGGDASSTGLRGRTLHSTDDHALMKIASKMFSTITIADRFLQNIKYENCFIGGEAIAFLVKTLQCSEAQALRTALRLTSMGWVHHVTFEHFLRNDFLFYQFNEAVFLAAPSLATSSTSASTVVRQKSLQEQGDGEWGEDFDIQGSSEGEGVDMRGDIDEAADDREGLQSLVDSLQRQSQRDKLELHRLEEMKEDLEEAVKDISQQATEEISTLRQKMSFLSQWLSVLLATYLCHCAAYLLSFLFYDSALTITSSYIVDTLVYVLNLSILEHFFHVPSYYLLLYIDPDSAHAPFDRLINKASGDLVMTDEQPRQRHDSLDSSSSSSSLLVALSEMGDDDERDDGGLSTLVPPSRTRRHRGWSIDSGFSAKSGGRTRLRSSSSEFGGSDRSLPTPVRYIRGCGGDLEEAELRWNETLEWRKINNIDRILKESQQHFWIIKELFPHFLHGRSVRDADGTGAGGYPIYYQQLYKIDFTELRARGVTKEHLLRHAVFLKEYIFTHVEPNDEDGQLITILDVRGMGLADVGGEALELWKAHSKVLQSHYVERSHQIFVVNASSMFRMIWKLVKPVLSPQTRRKVKIFREGADLSRLSRCVGAHQLPREYGGALGVVLGASEEERLLSLFVHRLNGTQKEEI